MLPRAIIPAILLLPLAGAAGAPPAEGGKFFEAEVQPILQAHCVACHGGAKKVRGGLRLTSRETLLQGGDTGPAVSLDSPEQSLLLEAINYHDLKMPPKGKLPQGQVNVLTRWVKMGAPWSTAAIKTARRHGPPPVDEQAKQFWAFRPVVRPQVPALKRAGWVRNPIDAFVLAKLEAAGLQPAPPADKVALLRRVHYDLIGLPPTPEEVDAFRADRSPDAYEKVVDRLLASPHHGERWARHWLDLVRYAETNSFERDGPKPNAWRYRDYVIRALNEDKPYAQFIREQLAGDELDRVTADGIIATGYYRLGQWDDEPVDREQAYYDGLDDIVATTGQVFLGLTVNCARCHDHKIDPFPQKDYYRLLAFFHGIRHYAPGAATQRSVAVSEEGTNPEERAKQEAALATHKKQLAKLDREIAAIENKVVPYLQGGERDDFKYKTNRPALVNKHAKELGRELHVKYDHLQQFRLAISRNRPPGPSEALCVTEMSPRETFVLLRGSPQACADKVEPGFPSVLTAAAPALPRPAAGSKTSGRRRVLADWIASPDNPLTARVMVNRLWQYHFGRGIVRSSSNFGYLGTPPTHPELLDWLAAEFAHPSPPTPLPSGERGARGATPLPSGARGAREPLAPLGRGVGVRGWSLKRLHKLILMSNAYRMSSRPDAAALARDPENDLLWRFDLRRLAAEEVRDSILAVCGNLNLQTIGGPSIYPTIPREVLAGQSQPGNGWKPSSPQDMARRSVYIHVKRSLAVPILAAFDAADTDASCPVRFTTTQPAQALGMLNSDFLNEQAKVFAEDLRKNAGDDPAAQVRLALRRTLQREPGAAEVVRGVRFIAKMRSKHQAAPAEALRSFCLLALNLNEFVYLD